MVGVVVDSVSDVITLAAEQIRPAPEFARRARHRSTSPAWARVDERMLILVDIERLMTSRDMELMERWPKRPEADNQGK